MLIAILVLLGLAGAVWYFARKQTQTVTLSQEDVAASDPTIQVAKETNERLKKMSKKIDKALAEAPELPSKKVKAEVAPEPVVDPILTVETPPVVEAAPIVEAAPLVEETYEITEEEFQSEVAAGSTDVVSEEVGTQKPVRKKKRRYYPKKK